MKCDICGENINRIEMGMVKKYKHKIVVCHKKTCDIDRNEEHWQELYTYFDGTAQPRYDIKIWSD